MPEFEGRVVAITGAAGGIGQALCRYFAREGASLVVIDQRTDVTSLAVELESAGVRASAFVLDIANAAAVHAALSDVAATLGPIDVLVNNAGATSHPVLERTSPAEFEREIAVNLTGAYACCHAALPGMVARRAGTIVTIGSVNGLAALGDAAYSAGKAGLISLTKAIALEYGRYNIRANIVCPGTVRTPIWDERVRRDPDVLATLTRWYPLRRLVEPIEVVRAVAFLASEAASAITGAVLPVDCGLSAGNLVMAAELTQEDF